MARLCGRPLGPGSTGTGHLDSAPCEVPRKRQRGSTSSCLPSSWHNRMLQPVSPPPPPPRPRQRAAQSGVQSDTRCAQRDELVCCTNRQEVLTRGTRGVKEATLSRLAAQGTPGGKFRDLQPSPYTPDSPQKVHGPPPGRVEPSPTCRTTTACT
jgi:hypothetical protein